MAEKKRLRSAARVRASHIVPMAMARALNSFVGEQLSYNFLK